MLVGIRAPCRLALLSLAESTHQYPDPGGTAVGAI
jgi:hypothetical protein